MNIPKAIEIALAKVLRRYAEMGKNTHLRPFQALKTDPSWSADPDRQFPLVDITATPPMTEENGSTLYSDASLLCGTLAADDPDHSALAKLYEAVQKAVDRMYSQFRSGTDGEELAAFRVEITAELGVESGAFSLGGLTFVEPTPRFDNDGANMIGIGLRISYSRTDF